MKPQSKTVVLLMGLGLLCATAANAQLTAFNSNVPAGFAVTGFIQAATLNPGGAANAGGTLTINNITMTVPDNSVIQMPANKLTWAQLFDVKQSAPVYDNSIPAQPAPPINHPANNSLGLPMTGLALSDAPATPAAAGTFPGFFPSCEVTVIGNIGTTGVTGSPQFVVGLILPVAQEIANAGAGFITFIDYPSGRFEVNGTLNKQNTGSVVEINDPLGRYGLAHSPDPRFTADTDNPTVHSGNGYPMGIPKVAPPAIDPDRPTFNRPLNPPLNPPPGAPFPHSPFLQVNAPLTAFKMPAAANPGTTRPDPWKQVPFMVGDFVAYSGNLYKLHPNDPVTPFDPARPVSATNRPMNQQFYISANTVTSDKLEFTTDTGPGPAYMSLERSKVGTGPAVPPPLVGRTVPAVPSLGINGAVVPVVEPKRNIVIVGFVTEPTALVDIFAVDVDPATGDENPRLLISVRPEAGPPAMGNKGRFRFEVGNAAVLPVTREFLVQTQHGTATLQDRQRNQQVGLNGGALCGLQWGQYQAPNFDYQIADAPPGFPVSASNFNDFPFLVKGEGFRNIGATSFACQPPNNVTVGPLTPFPPSTP
jgi:hypothetical protein